MSNIMDMDVYIRDVLEPFVGMANTEENRRMIVDSICKAFEGILLFPVLELASNVEVLTVDSFKIKTYVNLHKGHDEHEKPN